jgi:hypothetical protein
MSNPRLCAASRRVADGPLSAACLAFVLAVASPLLASPAFASGSVAARGTALDRLGPVAEGGVNSVAGIELEGAVDAEYALATVQAVQTGFGDNFSELDAAYILERGGRLFLVLTGNLEYNFNRLEIFFDTKGGGENVLTATPDYDEDLGAGNWSSNSLVGLKFDAAFTADYHLVASWGDPTGLRVLFVNRNGGGSATVPGAESTGAPRANNVSVGVINAGATTPNGSGSSLSDRLLFAIDNNNVAGLRGFEHSHSARAWSEFADKVLQGFGATRITDGYFITVCDGESRQLVVIKRLHPEADAIHSGGAKCGQPSDRAFRRKEVPDFRTSRWPA